MRAHEIKAEIVAATGRRTVFHDGNTFTITVLGDEPHNVAPVAEALRAARIPFRVKPKGKRFAGATYVVPVKNVGSTFNADWEYVR